MNKTLVIVVLLACLAAGLLGYVTAPHLNEKQPARSDITAAQDYLTVQEYGVEAQGTYLSYDEYEADVAEIINEEGIDG